MGGWIDSWMDDGRKKKGWREGRKDEKRDG
jgi:hypothetical protein